MDSELPHLVRPRPRRPGSRNIDSLRHFDISTDNDHSEPSTANDLPYSPLGRHHHQQQQQQDDSLAFEAGRSRSILNLTSPTLQGIYGNACDESAAPTPGSQTPSTLRSLKSSLRLALEEEPDEEQESPAATATATATANPHLPQHPLDAPTFLPKHRRGFSNLALPLLHRAVVLFAIGFSYGSLITRLHNSSPRVSFDSGLSAVPSAANITATVASSLSSLWPLSAAWPLLPTIVIEDGLWWWFRLSWGFAGIVFGTLLPYLDFRLQLRHIKKLSKHNGSAIASRGDSTSSSLAITQRTSSIPPERRGSGTVSSRRASLIDEVALYPKESGTLGDWNPMIRGIGVFIGIAFAIRNLPWESTQQVSLTLALVNPFLWYIVDGTKAGFVLSSVVATAGSLLLLLVNPDIVPPPATFSLLSNRGSIALGGTTALQYETIAVTLWIASVLFCSCVCFGNIGRRMMLR